MTVIVHTEYHDWSEALGFDTKGKREWRLERPDQPGCMRPGVDFEGEDAVVVAFGSRDGYFAASCAGRVRPYVSRIARDAWTLIATETLRGGVDAFAVARSASGDTLWVVTAEGELWRRSGTDWERVALPTRDGSPLLAERVAVAGDGDVWITAGFGGSRDPKTVGYPLYRRASDEHGALLHLRPGTIPLPLPR